jgi:predicted ATPase
VYAERVASESIAVDVEGWADVLAGLLPRQALSELGASERVTGMTTIEAGLDPEGAGFRLFEAVAEVLGRAAAQTPLLLVLDDRQWADMPSLLLLQFVMRDASRRPILILGTYRGTDVDWEDERGRPLSELGSPGGVLRLRGLDVDQVSELIATIAGARPSHENASAVHDRAGGNPLIVLELAGLPSEFWNVPGRRFDAEQPSIPQRVRAVLEHRLAVLSERCINALDVASVIGTEFQLDVLGRVLGDPDDAV